MMKNGLLIILICCFVGNLNAQIDNKPEGFKKYAILAEISNREAGMGIKYTWDNKWFIPLSVGISNEFHERKWNDWYLNLKPYYLLGHRRICFPVGLTGGIRFINDYGYHFPVVWGGAYGGALYRLGSNQEIGVNVGVKYGKKSHLIKRDEIWGTVSAYETYRERPVFFEVNYSYRF